MHSLGAAVEGESSRRRRRRRTASRRSSAPDDGAAHPPASSASSIGSSSSSSSFAAVVVVATFAALASQCGAISTAASDAPPNAHRPSWQRRSSRLTLIGPHGDMAHSDAASTTMQTHPSATDETPPAAAAPSVRGVRTFSVADYGGKGDGKFDNTGAIASAFAACGASGGGRVYFPPGLWLTYPFNLTSNTEMFLDGPDCVVAAQTDLQRWPTVPWREWPMPPTYPPRPRRIAFVFGDRVENVTITGGGVLDGQGEQWWGPSGRPNGKGGGPAAAPGSPGLLHIVGGRNITVEDVHFRNGGAWMVHPQFCRGVLIRRVTATAPRASHGTNGIVIDSSEDVRVLDSTVETGSKEDAFVVKSGTGKFGREAGVPARNILFQGCVVRSGHAVSVGSETSGGIYNVTFKDIHFDGTQTGGFGAGSVRVKTKRGRGGTVDGILFEDITGTEAIYGVEFYMEYGDNKGKKPLQVAGSPSDVPRVRNVTVRNMYIDGTTRVAGILSGLPDSPFENLRLENITVRNARKGGWECHKFSECTWKGGGCALGYVSAVSPAVPKGCVLPPTDGIRSLAVA